VSPVCGKTTGGARRTSPTAPATPQVAHRGDAQGKTVGELVVGGAGCRNGWRWCRPPRVSHLRRHRPLNRRSQVGVSRTVWVGIIGSVPRAFVGLAVCVRVLGLCVGVLGELWWQRRCSPWVPGDWWMASPGACRRARAPRSLLGTPTRAGARMRGATGASLPRRADGIKVWRPRICIA
jgi:hypothetical protein